MSPLPEHEDYKDFVSHAVRALSDELGIELEPRWGSATWKRRTFRKGAEPDTCFYVANAHRIIGKPKIDLDSDPPPDIVVEIDMTNESLSKFPIYAAIGVPEIWRYDGKRFPDVSTGRRHLYGNRSQPLFSPSQLPYARQRA